MSRRITRRHFVASAAGALAAPAFLRARNANEKLNIAMIGSGGRGLANLKEVESESIVALCDVDQSGVEMAAQKHRDAARYADFRKLYDEMANKIDAVVVSTCEHTHAVATLPALELGKHVYCEKPLTHGIWEARVIREKAAKTKVATQMGNQNHARDNFRRVIELVRSGAVGPVREAHVWVSRAWGLQSPEAARKFEDHKAFGDQMVGLDARPKEAEKMPPGLDWDLWLGPAPARPFHSVYVPGPKWYRWWDFASGTMSDLGSHWNDLPFWALKLQAPLTIEASGPPPHPELAPASMQATYEYGPRGDMPAVKLTWYQGVNKPDLWTQKKVPQWPNGVLFVGDKGMILSEAGKHVLLPEKEFADFKRPEPFIPNSPGHYAEWIQAAKTGSPTLSNFEYAGWLTEANHLGSIAYRLGKKLEWDAAAMRAKNAPEADALIKREYRKGWKLV
ncbi:MAG TPA: Gfo/Idh/MocA family oxidoreductase [Gemmataceae bacterium]|jgi:predicted dehydrogenase|nr:Gfo/Idh/MocA family oxidoreductase [Gemmataceae bacterium]